MKMKKYASFNEYLIDQSPKNRSIIRALRKFVKRVEPKLEETVNGDGENSRKRAQCPFRHGNCCESMMTTKLSEM